MKEPPANPSDSPVGDTTVHIGYDWAYTSPQVAVLEAVSDATDARTTDLPPLHSSVDPDALDALFERTHDGSDGSVRIDFSYADREVTVEGEGAVVVGPEEGVD